MKYHNITKCDILNGSGVRTVLWVSGCPHACKGCHNVVTWNPTVGLDFEVDALRELMDALANPYCDGLTLSGGDPLASYNRAVIADLVKMVKTVHPNKTIWVYTGFTFEEISESLIDILQYVDVLVDGKFKEELSDTGLQYRGSSNQRIIDVQKSLLLGEAVIHMN